MSAALLMVLAAAPISVDYRGTLGEALNEIATKGGINLVATGELNVPAEVHLKDMSADDVLEALAAVHHLEVTKKGKLWVVKPAEGAAMVAVPAVAPLPPLPPVPPLPPLPPAPPAGSIEQLEAEAQAAQQHADEAEQRADALRDKAEALRDAEEAKREEDEARVDEAKAVVEHAKTAQAPVAGRTGRDTADGKHKKNVSTGAIKIADGEHVEDVVSYGGSVTLGNSVHADGSVVAFGGDVLMGDGVVVDGDAVSFGGRIKKGNGSKVRGEELSFGSGGFGAAAVKPMVKAADTGDEHGGGVAGFLLQFGAFFALGFLLMMFAPNRMRNIEAEIRAQPVKSGLAGLLALIGALPLTIMLGLTVVGIPVAMLMWLFGGLTSVMGLLALANVLGNRFPIARLRRTQAIVLAVGVLLMLLVGSIPVLGAFFWTASLCVSFGAILRTRVGQKSLGLPIPENGGFIS